MTNPPIFNVPDPDWTALRGLVETWMLPSGKRQAIVLMDRVEHTQERPRPPRDDDDDYDGEEDDNG